ncbi:oxidoreductase [Pantoea eucalypti]|jgi:NAD(P)-dependent dehydrogenase (short-subunit alcohol dehydrogenase family)|uniref:SDR family NAD(P)-dependent oxidoreductase n=1 Tax=Pantoea eucalypti TaxID=470933 RepID=A0ABY2ZGF7_9GAMM|nr:MULTISPECIES: oxidoreductase [Pantoea]PQL29586.1 short-chain dehydrogenase/reductase [Pantoea ananatis]QXG55900.1 SDR family NAD(P)-dependent oxidoreductase [Pantoea jilinensis]AWP32484.1 short-chain dehydrogenase/reductase [Pantoea vagans]MBD9551732.1 SDR family NAD(P)-dependent oxidoreductase [Pantoea sp. PNT01]MCD2355352.1 SDR family NAD(P)-dependent oxidoreductase [Pantoea sp. MHSD4]
MTAHSSPVWLISGCSTGFGRELAQQTIARGFKVVVTARDTASIADLVEGHDNALAVALDVTQQSSIDQAVSAALDTFGTIDVLVNNAGYGYQSSVEEGVESEIRAQFDANVFGLFALTRAVLPAMRKARSGHVINITSVAGLIGFASSGYYSASKHAVEGWSDSLALEAGPLGIHVTCVEPGPFRTDWAGRSLHQTPSTLPDYAETAAARMKATSEYSGTQKGDPARAAAAMIAITEHENPPRHLVMGAWGHDAVTGKLKERLAEIDAWKQTSVETDFPE